MLQIEAAGAEGRALGYPSVPVLEPITAAISWTNHDISQGTTLQIGFSFGHYIPEADNISWHVFRVWGVMYAWGARATVQAPAPGTTRIEYIPCYPVHQWYIRTGGVFASHVFIGQGKLDVLEDECMAGVRQIALLYSDISAMYQRGWIDMVHQQQTLEVTQAPERFTDTLGIQLIKA